MTGALRLKLTALGIVIGAGLAVGVWTIAAAVRADHERLLEISNTPRGLAHPKPIGADIPDIFDREGPVTPEEIAYVTTPLPMPEGEPTVVLVHGPEPRLVTWGEFEAGNESATANPTYTTYFVKQDRAVEHRGTGDPVVRRTFLGEDYMLQSVAIELGFADRAYPFDYQRERVDRPISERLQAARGHLAGPFDPRVAPWLEALGEPDEVYETYIVSPILEEDRVIERVHMLRSQKHGAGIGSPPRPEGVVHPSWQDYERTYTTLDGRPVDRPFRHVYVVDTIWVYNNPDEVNPYPRAHGYDMNDLLDLEISERGTSTRGLVPRMDLWRMEIPELNDEARYRRLQHELRPHPLGEAVVTLLEQRITETPANKEPTPDPAENTP